MIQKTYNKVEYTITSATAEDPRITFDFRCWAVSDIQVWLYNPETKTSVILILAVDYNISLYNGSDGGVVTLRTETGSIFSGGFPLGYTIAVMRVLPITQDINLPENGKLPSTGVEAQMDKTIMICQQMQEELSRAVKVPPGGATIDNLDSLVEVAAKHAHNALVYASGGTLTSGTAYTSGAMQFRDTASGHAVAAGEQVASAIAQVGSASGFTHNAEVYASGGVLIGGGTVLGAYDYAVMASWQKEDAEAYCSGGTLTDQVTYTSGAKGYADMARDIVDDLRGGQVVHDISSMTVTRGGVTYCEIPYEDRHIYSGDFPIGGNVSKILLKPGATVRGGRMITFELHLNNTDSTQPAFYTSSGTSITTATVLYRTDTEPIYGDASALPLPTIGEVRCITVRTRGQGSYMVNEAYVGGF